MNTQPDTQPWATRPVGENRARILAYIHTYAAEHGGRTPTIREIGDAVGISSTSVVNYHLNKLAASGDLMREPNISRGIVLPVQVRP